jgi:hypothetical protein
VDLPYDKQRLEVVEAVARTGIAYSHESRNIARELLDLRKQLEQLQRPQGTLDYLGFGP